VLLGCQFRVPCYGLQHDRPDRLEAALERLALELCARHRQWQTQLTTTVSIDGNNDDDDDDDSDEDDSDVAVIRFRRRLRMRRELRTVGLVLNATSPMPPTKLFAMFEECGLKLLVLTDGI
jgi:hypothetical protein